MLHSNGSCALYLAGGGARAAYQVGVLKALNTVFKNNGHSLPFDIISGVSAGAINAAMLASCADDYSKGVQQLDELWSNLHCQRIYRVSYAALLKSLFRNLTAFFNPYNQPKNDYLLDTTPLSQLLEQKIDFTSLNKHIEAGHLEAFEVAANCYELAETVSFYNSVVPQAGWHKARHISYQSQIRKEHILASSAIPIFFKAVEVGGLHFGDGTLRLTSPLRACVNLGADKILIITNRAFSRPYDLDPTQKKPITFNRLIGNLMNALFLDNVERDIELLTKMNQVVDNGAGKAPWRSIKTLCLSPSQDLGEIAGQFAKQLPPLLRFLLHSRNASTSGDILSFLLFEAAYTQKLIALGYEDALRQSEAIIRFFSEP